ncbi:TspO/MBR family protein [Ventrimonas sp. CLA-AP-H27]|uniref:TspO/MBR family protein n=1 Tax=Ventrimonas faecis TaxID=3133170 RepID=A0ABV1HHF9_9FIRM
MDSTTQTRALKTYGTQLVVNFFWPILFFLGKQYTIAFAWLCFLWYLVYSCLNQFYLLSRKAGNLLVPYLVWLTYAGYLNLLIAILN